MVRGSLFFVVLSLTILSLSNYTANSCPTADTDIPLPDGTMELWKIEKPIVEAKMKESPVEYINTLQTPEMTIKPPSRIKFKLWMGGNKFRDIYIVKRNEATYAYIYVEEGLNDIISQSIIDEASTCVDRVYPRLSNYIADPETRSADSYDKILVIIANITHFAGYFSAAWETGAYGSSYGDNGKLDCIVVASESYYVRYNAWGTIAHEIGHMLSYKFGGGLKEKWLEEGLAEYASYVGEGKLVDSHRTRINYFEEDPGRYSLKWAWIPPDLKGRNALYGVSFLFVYYISEKYGGSNTIKKIVTRSGTNLDGAELIDYVLRSYHVTFSDIFKNWVIANYLDDPDVDPLYGYTNLDLQVSTADKTFSWKTVTVRDTVNEWAADYIKITATNRIYMQIRFRGEGAWWIFDKWIHSDYIVSIIFCSTTYPNGKVVELVSDHKGDCLIKKPREFDKIVMVVACTNHWDFRSWHGNGRYTVILRFPPILALYHLLTGQVPWDEIQGYQMIKPQLNYPSMI